MRPPAGPADQGAQLRLPGEPPPVLVLDAYSLLFRAFHALPPMTTAAGEPTSALYGLSVLLLKLFREERPALAIAALDLAAPTFRHVAYPAYKGNRPATPSALGRQVARLPELLEAWNIPVVAAAGFEADDVIATLARQLGGEARAPLVVSGDRDLLQLARPPCEVLYVSRGPGKSERYDAAAVERRFGVPPSMLPDYVALVGDPSDNLPGVPGIGGKTAARLLRDHDGLVGLLGGLGQVTPPRIRDTLAEHAGMLPLWLAMATLRDDVPLAGLPLYTGEVDPARIRAFFERLEFRSLLPRLEGALGA